MLYIIYSTIQRMFILKIGVFNTTLEQYFTGHVLNSVGPEGGGSPPGTEDE